MEILHTKTITETINDRLDNPLQKLDDRTWDIILNGKKKFKFHLLNVQDTAVHVGNDNIKIFRRLDFGFETKACSTKSRKSKLISKLITQGKGKFLCLLFLAR